VIAAAVSGVAVLALFLNTEDTEATQRKSKS
jgi:hypothetical protein